ncbi:hypothetical protein [Polyangium sp. y55x31]|uniref:hypothetical protein n=1 Tax=Polyangium sp. y55x31 TaxID=3042688 RepID=UPI0024822E7D|nr:hypothetical protein [Polyangium sp. y55x31]MDI1479828.1 hypothetical protein [Polyangium sp. y55x31]
MRTSQMLFAAVSIVAAASLTAACDAPAGAGDSKGPSKGAAESTFVFAGKRGSAGQAWRSLGPDGTEKLHGETRLMLASGAERQVVEDVTLDVSGRIVSAEITTTSSAPNELPVWLRLAPSEGLVRVVSGSSETSFRVPADAPWVYTALPAGIPATPIAAWIAKRGADTAPWLRVVSASEARSFLAPLDQVVVRTETGTTVVLGRDAADTDTVFVRDLRLSDGEVLTRTNGPALVL